MSKALATKNVAAVLLGIGMILSVFAFATPAKAQTMDLQSQINALLAQIAALQGGSTTSSSCSFTFTANLKMGSKGTEVMNLQKFLNKSSDTMVASSGAGSAGNETSTFGPATKAAVIKFQEKYAADVLTPNGLSKGTGNWFASTRAKANMLCSTTGPTTGPTTPGTTPGTLMVTAGSQPANSLAPTGASRVPFTNFTLTNSSGAAVTVNGITVTRTGLAADAAFSGVVLLDQNGLQVGTPRTFDTNHMATIGEMMTLQPGQSATFTVAGNITTVNASNYAGQVAALTVTGINTTATVSGSLPITGANQTINASLALGTATLERSSFDPNAGLTKNIGDTAVKFSGIRITAGSAEDVRLFSVRWRLNGSASASDISNVMTVVNGTSYPTVLSADGRYYTTTVAGGVLMTKGNSVDVYIQGDITGSNSNTRIIELDIDRASDIYVVGQTYGYGITPTASYNGTTPLTTTAHSSGFYGTGSTNAQPFFQGSTVLVQGSSVTTIARATEVPSQNIAVNVPTQPFGGFVADIKGEALTIQTMVFGINGVATTTTNQITNITLVDDAGVVVAGPVDAVGNVVTFNNSITLKSGRHVYTLKGKVPSAAANGGTFAVSVDTALWTGVTGQTTGNTVVIPVSTFTLNTMTVRAATLNITASAQPAAQTIVAGGSSVLLANIQLDASQSGEDVRLNQLPIRFTSNTGVSSCQLWNGTTAVNTGSNVPSSISVGANTFTFDNSLTIAKGTVITLAVKCNLSSAASGAYNTGVNSADTFTATGVQSGNTLTSTLTVSTSNSGTQTVGTSSLVVSTDPSSPSFAYAAGGTTGVTAAALKFRGTSEDMTLTELGLTGSTGISSDIIQATIWNGATQVGTVTFTSGSLTATSTLSTPVNLPKDTDVVLTVKINVANVGASQSGTAGRTVTLNFSGAKATGNNSGSTLYATGSSSVAGVRIERTYPTVALVSLGSTGVADGKLIRFSVTANAGGTLGVEKFNFSIATSTASAASYNLYAYNDSGFVNTVSAAPSGQLNATAVGGVGTSLVTIRTNNVTGGVLQIPAGQTYYFELRASVTGVATGASITTTLLGDTNSTSAGATSTLSSANFFWTPNSTTTATISDSTNPDWRNGYGIPGLPASGLSQTRNQ